MWWINSYAPCTPKPHNHFYVQQHIWWAFWQQLLLSCLILDSPILFLCKLYTGCATTADTSRNKNTKPNGSREPRDFGNMQGWTTGFLEQFCVMVPMPLGPMWLIFFDTLFSYIIWYIFYCIAFWTAYGIAYCIAYCVAYCVAYCLSYCLWYCILYCLCSEKTL